MLTSRVACFHTFAHQSNVLAVVALRVIGVSVGSTHVVGAGVGINVRAGDGVCRSALHSHGSQVGHVLTAVNLQMRTERLKNERCRSEDKSYEEVYQTHRNGLGWVRTVTSSGVHDFVSLQVCWIVVFQIPTIELLQDAGVLYKQQKCLENTSLA